MCHSIVVCNLNYLGHLPADLTAFFFSVLSQCGNVVGNDEGVRESDFLDAHQAFVILLRVATGWDKSSRIFPLRYKYVQRNFNLVVQPESIAIVERVRSRRGVRLFCAMQGSADLK